jgi:hypothetical protein
MKDETSGRRVLNLHVLRVRQRIASGIHTGSTIKGSLCDTRSDPTDGYGCSTNVCTAVCSVTHLGSCA